MVTICCQQVHTPEVAARQRSAHVIEQRGAALGRQLAEAGGAKQEQRRAVPLPPGHHRLRPLQQRPQRTLLKPCRRLLRLPLSLYIGLT